MKMPTPSCRFIEHTAAFGSQSRAGARRDPNVPGNRSSWVAVAERRIATTPPRARQAFLLFAVERLQHGTIAEILNCDEEMLLALIDEAAKVIVGQTGTNMMLTEDPPIIAMNLAAIVFRPTFRNCEVKRC